MFIRPALRDIVELEDTVEGKTPNRAKNRCSGDVGEERVGMWSNKGRRDMLEECGGKKLEGGALKNGSERSDAVGEKRFAAGRNH